MVASDLVDALANPCASLHRLYASSDSIADSFPESVTAHYSSIFASQSAFQEIPSLSVSNPPEKFHNDENPPLVRFRGMIQDTSASPEMYLSKTRENRPGGWGIPVDIQDDNFSYEDLRECILLWAVSVPGEAEWRSRELDGYAEPNTLERHSAAKPHKFPISGAPHIGLNVKVYDAKQGPFRATDICTFVGILTLEQSTPDSELSKPIDVPTLHVLYSFPSHLSKIYPQPNITQETRAGLIDWIADEAFQGDKLAAEWTLLASVARVQSRTPSLVPLSLSLAKIPPSPAQDLPPKLAHVLKLILPTFVSIPLTLDVLNKQPFMPRSEDEDLHSGWLQLPEATTLLISEGGISEGTVQDRGLSNIRSLQTVMKDQSLDYVFPFSRFTFTTDISVIVLTQGTKSPFFQTDVTLHLLPEISTESFYGSAEKVNLPNEVLLEDFRRLVIATKAQAGKAVISESTSARIQGDFVKERQESKITTDDFILRMSLTRLIALSHHSKEVTVDHWERAKYLDAERVKRMR